ncbi:transcriptional regulator [Micromonospora globispora]|uniref:Transcriptional regulator n=1 Tax=Micromonospora globispora TaxID=1450148 RepID=A0A317K9J4_9ACTN|nr:helix-turn-helix domain-containing protein [Micromonospora globispora]PWU50136.1 transcriptional regulator [Micromonospora globispora]RQX00700.1 transcriptional regulator [Micromonospora globispora]
MPAQRGYRQACGVARGLDIVGERWSLLVVRELLLGPKRFTDLQQALPTASPNALSDRLRELADAGVVRRRQLPPPGNVRVYELTAWGRGLEPIVVALGTWALAAPPTAEQRFVSADSAMLTIRTFFVPTQQRPEATLRIELRDHGPAGVFGVRLTPDGAEVAHEPPEEPDAVLVTTTDALLGAFGGDDLAGLVAAGAVIGDPEVVRLLVANVRISASTNQYATATSHLRGRAEGRQTLSEG